MVREVLGSLYSANLQAIACLAESLDHSIQGLSAYLVACVCTAEDTAITGCWFGKDLAD